MSILEVGSRDHLSEEVERRTDLILDVLYRIGSCAEREITVPGVDFANVSPKTLSYLSTPELRALVARLDGALQEHLRQRSKLILRRVSRGIATVGAAVVAVMMFSSPSCSGRGSPSETSNETP